MIIENNCDGASTGSAAVYLQEGFGEQVQLVFREVQILGNFVFVGRDEPLYVFLDQFDGCCPARLAVIAQGTVLSCRQLEGNRMVMVIATFPFLVLCHNTLV